MEDYRRLRFLAQVILPLWDRSESYRKVWLWTVPHNHFSPSTRARGQTSCRPSDLQARRLGTKSEYRVVVSRVLPSDPLRSGGKNIRASILRIRSRFSN